MVCLPLGGTSIKHHRTLKQLRTTTHDVTHVTRILKTCYRVSRRSRENISRGTWKASSAPVFTSCHRLASTVVKASGEPHHFAKNKRLPITRRNDEHEQDWGVHNPCLRRCRRLVLQSLSFAHARNSANQRTSVSTCLCQEQFRGALVFTWVAGAPKKTNTRSAHDEQWPCQ